MSKERDGGGRTALGARARGDFERRRASVLPRFVFSSDLLRECARRVDYTRIWRERTAYLLGKADGNGRRVVTRIVEVPSPGVEALTAWSSLAGWNTPCARFRLIEPSQEGGYGRIYPRKRWFH